MSINNITTRNSKIHIQVVSFFGGAAFGAAIMGTAMWLDNTSPRWPFIAFALSASVFNFVIVRLVNKLHSN